ncbi:unnamed protein product [Cunninghamella echinulata]
MKKISSTEINKLLEDLNINFEITNNRLYIYSTRNRFRSDLYYKRCEDGTKIMAVKAVIKSGLIEYYYANFNEAMLWYRYYTCKRHHIEPSKINCHYFAKIPKHYRNLPPNKGLSIVKEALVYFIIHYNGIPPYFNMNYLDENICKIID